MRRVTFLGFSAALAAGAALAFQGQADFSGAWSTSEGQMTLGQSGGQVRGTYSQDNGRIEGQVQGNRLAGFWAEDSSGQRCGYERLGSFYWGRVDWAMAPDGRSFAGPWAYCESPLSGSWTGTRTGPAPKPAGADFSGPWDTSEGQMTLSQGGGQVRGTYSQDNGRIEGEVNGNRLAAVWGEDSSGQRCSSQRLGTYYWGRVTWTMAPDGRSFAGPWSYCDNPLSGSWTGTRR